MSFNLNDYAKEKKRNETEETADGVSAEKSGAFSLNEYAKSREADENSYIDRINSWQKNISDFADSYSDEYSKRDGLYKADFGSYENSTVKRADELIAEARALEKYFSGKGDTYKDTLDALSANTDYLWNVKSALAEERVYRDKFADEDSWNTNQKYLKWQEMPNSENFDIDSEYVSPGTHDTWYAKGIYNDTLYEIINGVLNNENYKDYSGYDGKYVASPGFSDTRDTGGTPEDLLFAKNLTDDQRKTYNAIYKREGAAAAREYYDAVKTREYSVLDSAMYGFAAPLVSPVAAVASLFGDEGKAFGSEILKEQMLRKEAHPTAYGIGETAGNIAETVAISRLVSGVASAATSKFASALISGAEKAAAKTGTAAVSYATKAGLTKAASIGVNAIKDHMIFALKTAVNESGYLAYGNISPNEFGNHILRSGAAGAASSLVGSLTSLGLEKVFVSAQLQTGFAEYVRNLFSSTASAAAYGLTDYAVADEKPSSEEMWKNLAISFAFSTVTSYMQTFRTTSAAAESIGKRYDKISDEFSALEKATSGRKYTEEGATEILTAIAEECDDLIGELSNTYYAGQQKFVSEMLESLRALRDSVGLRLSGFTGSTSASGAASSGFVNAIGSAVANGIRSGFQAAEPSGTAQAIGGLTKTPANAEINTGAVAANAVGSTQNAVGIAASAPVVSQSVPSSVGNIPSQTIIKGEQTSSGEASKIAPETGEDGIKRLASKYDSAGKKAMIENYDGGDAVQYAKDFNAYYEAGRQGKPVTSPVSLTDSQAEAAFKAGVKDAKNPLASDGVKGYNKEKTNAEFFAEASDEQKLFPSGNRNPESYKYVTVSEGIDGDVQFRFYNNQKLAERNMQIYSATTGNKIELVKVGESGSVSQAVKTIFGGDYGKQENAYYGEGRVRNFAQRSGGSAEGIYGASEEARGNDNFRRNDRRIFEASSRNVQGKELISEATDADIRISDGVSEESSALAKKNGAKAISFEGELKLEDGGVAEGFYSPDTDTIGAQIDNVEFEQADLIRHEIMERKIARGEVRVEDAVARARQLLDDPTLIDSCAEYLAAHYCAKNTSDLTPEEIAAATKELVCDGADHLNRLRYVVDNGYVSAKTRETADAFDLVLDALNQANRELTGGAFDVYLDFSEAVDVVKGGKTVAVANENGNTVFSRSTFRDGGREALQKYLDGEVKKGLSRESADDILRQMDDFYRITTAFADKYGSFGEWSEAKVVTDENGNTVFSVVKPNGEYVMNLDFSLVCKKRRALDAVFNSMVRQGTIESYDELTQEDIAEINNIIRDFGFETACALCFVDAKRFRQGIVSDGFVSQYNRLVYSMAKKGQTIDYFNFGGNKSVVNTGNGIDTLPDSELDFTEINKALNENGKKTVEYKAALLLKQNSAQRKLLMRGDFMSTAGFDTLNKTNKDILRLYNSKKGAGGPKAAQSDVQYLNEIISSKAFDREKAYSIGGVRIQSFSDYIANLVFDYLQMTADLAAKRLPAHAYTKESLFALQFGKTGIKINLSLVPAVVENGVASGLDANGNYAWIDGQSFGSDANIKGSAQTGYELALKIQSAEGYTQNCGTIAVGVSDEQITKMLSDPNIRMVIPYHLSSLNHVVATMNNIDQYTDYTNQQRTKGKNGKAVSDKKEFNFNERLQKLGDAKKAADEYLAWCRKNGYTPKFSQFAYHENYYKLLEDFTCYDKYGNPAMQGDVKMSFPTKSDPFGSMNDLMEQGLNENDVRQHKLDSEVNKMAERIDAVLKDKKSQFSKKLNVSGNNDRASEAAATEENKITVDDVRTLRSIGRKSINDFTSEDITKAEKWARKFYSELKEKSPFFRAWFGDWRAYDKTRIELPTQTSKEYSAGKTTNADTGKVISWGNSLYSETVVHAVKEKISVDALNDIEEIVGKAILLDTVVSEKTSAAKMANTAFMHSFYTIYRGELVKLYVEEALSNKGNEVFTRAYELKDIQKIVAAPTGVLAKNGGLTYETATNISVSDLFDLVKRYDKDFHPKPVNPILLNEDGTPKVFYHQTENDFTVFDIGREGAGTRDNETPFGIFLKSSDKDIGLRGKKQMPLYAQAQSPLIAKNRYELVERLKKMSGVYAELYEKSKSIDRDYKIREEKAAQDFKDYVARNAQSENRKTRQEMYADPEFQKVLEAEDKIVEEWTAKAAENDLAMKREIERVLRDNGYDSVILKEDAGSFGRMTDAVIVLDNTQVKSATDNIGTFNHGNEDIQYSRKLTFTREDIDKARLEERWKAAEKLNEVRQDRDGVSDSKWRTTRIADAKGELKPLSQILEQMRHDLGFNLTYGHIRGQNTLGQFNRRDKGIRARTVNDLPVISHEIGHFLDDKFGIRNGIPKNVAAELHNALGELKDAYDPSKWTTEGLAEYVRMYLRNRDEASVRYPEATKYILGKLDAKSLALIQQFSDECNAYFALDGENAKSSIRLREEKPYDARSFPERIKDTSDIFYQAWIDSNASIKKISEKAYMYATNSAYTDAVAGQIIVGDLTDINGKYVAPGLKTVLKGINTRDKAEYADFGEYLVMKHGLEYLAEGKRVFADNTKNNADFMNRRIAELEKQYPQFKEASERLYRFISSLTKTWGVDLGVISPDAFNEWQKARPCYVPFNRVMDKGKGGIGAKRGFANQGNPFKRAVGSGREIINPVDSVIDNIVKLVNVGSRNNVMKIITNTAEGEGLTATILEKIPSPMIRRGVNIGSTKAELLQRIEALLNGNADLIGQVDELFQNFDDIIYQFSVGKAHGDIVTVLKKGKAEFWKINDPLLLESITNMSPAASHGVVGAIGKITRFMTANITGNNVVWSIFSNAPRDLQTFLTYSKNISNTHGLSKVPEFAKTMKALAAAYIEPFKDRLGKTSPLYREYLALGGGHQSAYSADSDLALNARKQITKNTFQRAIEFLNPINTVSLISDAIEGGPRFATYSLMRNIGLSPQEAFYEAMDVTVNFRKSGVYGRGVNKAVPFFNAGLQGTDKLFRFLSADDVKGSSRKKAVIGRLAAFFASAAILATLDYVINNRSDDDKENYQMLSTYTKNNYWCIPLGDGKYFAIPRGRELGVLASLIERSYEATFGENPHAFDDFYNYATDAILPSTVSDAFQLPANIAENGFGEGVEETVYGVLGGIGIIGVFANMGANRDFLGRPIESAALQRREPKDRYTGSTSKLAQLFGQAFNASPQMVDYFGNQVLGYIWQTNQALFPVDDSRRDLTLGVKNKYYKDNLYSTDIINWLYDYSDALSMKKNSSDDIDVAIESKLASNMTTVWSRYSSAVRDMPESDEKTRNSRRLVQQMFYDYRTATESGKQTESQKLVTSIVKAENDTELLPSVMNNYIKDADGTVHKLTGSQYYEYQSLYNNYYYTFAEQAIKKNMSQLEKERTLKQAKAYAKTKATNEMSYLLNISSEEDKYTDVPDDKVVTFKAQVDIADDDGLEQKEVIEILKGMISDGLSFEDAYTLFHSRYESDKNNPWAIFKK